MKTKEEIRLVMEWDGRGFRYFLCNPPLNPKGLKFNDGVQLSIKSQRVDRIDAAKILGVDIKDLP